MKRHSKINPNILQRQINYQEKEIAVLKEEMDRFTALHTAMINKDFRFSDMACPVCCITKTEIEHIIFVYKDYYKRSHSKLERLRAKQSLIGE